jgi:acetyl-CoA C-acetyltransferase
VSARGVVIGGVGAVSQRLDDVDAAVEAVELMVRAVEAAGVPRLVRRADALMVPTGMWGYRDAGRLVARRVGADRARTVRGEIGVLQTTLVNRAAALIADGSADVVVVVGGEARYRALRASITGVAAPETVQAPDAPDARPDDVLEPAADIISPHEIARGLVAPVQHYAMLDNAMRAHDGQTIAQHASAIADLWASFNEVAQGNPDAWHRAPMGAQAIATPSAQNRPLAFPYQKWHNSQWNVDQAAAVVLCSPQAARDVGIDVGSAVWIEAGTEANQMVPVAARGELWHCPAVEVAGRRALALAGVALADIELFEIYSCFPAAVRQQARALGLPDDGSRPLTVTGGMTFAGGPLNNFVLQAIVKMVERLGALGPGAHGLVTAVSGMLTKQGFVVLGTGAGAAASGPGPDHGSPEPGFAFADCTAEAAAATPVRSLLGEHAGEGTVATYTVLYDGLSPTTIAAVIDVSPAERVVALCPDPVAAEEATRVELCGRSVAVHGTTFAVH